VGAVAGNVGNPNCLITQLQLSCELAGGGGRKGKEGEREKRWGDKPQRQ